jgi:hypothetical protein
MNKNLLNKVTATVAAAGAALLAVVALAAPAEASPGVAIPTHLGHHNWINDIDGPKAHAPRVDTSVHIGPVTGTLHISRAR